jgi:hypothetical protein
MDYLLVAGLVLILVLWGSGGRRFLKQSGWRIATGALAIGVLAAAGFVALRGGWLKGLLIAVIGLMLAISSRWPRAASVQSPAPGMDLATARLTLGVGPQASAAEIQAAYARLIRLAHPDQGGTTGLAIQLNLARDRLLKG